MDPVSFRQKIEKTEQLVANVAPQVLQHESRIKQLENDMLELKRFMNVLLGRDQ